MNILSPTYVLFVPLVWLLAQLLRTTRQRQVLLLIASYVFYSAFGLTFLAVLVASSAVNYAWGRVMRRSLTVGNLWIGIALNLLLLVVFKYVPSFNWLYPNSPLARIVMPLGISFWTFQAISYLSDLYREEELDPSPLEFFLYMAFWPTVLSGPVCRLTDVLPQFRKMSRPTWDDLAAGMPRVILGVFMKLVPAQMLADGISAGEGLNAGFDQIKGGWGGLDVWFLVFAYGFSLFFDFAGYSHVVIGTGRLFGLELRENFDRPYLSTTPSVFWTRWHMSLSSWIRDYVFMPMAPMRRENWWRLFVLALAMVLFGLWHNATLPFVIWGAYHGVILVLHRQVQSFKKARNIEPPAWVETPLAWGVTLLVICFGWIFFRAHDIGQIAEMVSAAVNPLSYGRLVLRANFYIVTALVIGSYFALELMRVGIERLRERPWGERVTWLVSPAYYAALILLLVAWSQQETVFVYFAF